MMQGNRISETAIGMMHENEFWRQLEWAVCRTMAASEDRSIARFFTCDGLERVRFDFDSQPPRVLGTAWMLGRKNEEWQFVLLLPPTFLSFDSIQWDAILPASGEQVDIDLDFAKCVLTISCGRP